MSDDAVTEEVRATYDMVAAEYASRFPGTEPEQAVELAMIDHLISQLALPSRDVLDAGCGTGRMSRYLADRGCLVHGVDLSPGMIAMARRDHADIDTRVASMTNLPFPDARFDGILYWYSVIHVSDADVAAAFGEARRVLRPNGVVLVAFQAGEGVRCCCGISQARLRRHPDALSSHARSGVRAARSGGVQRRSEARARASRRRER